MEFSINYLAVAASAVSAMVLGFLWYGPIFGKQWMKLSGHKMEGGEAGKAMANRGYMLQGVGALVTAYVLAHFVIIAGATTLNDALTLGAWLWFGFVATVLLGTVAWENKPWMLYVLNVGYQLVNLLVMATILTLWH